LKNFLASEISCSNCCHLTICVYSNFCWISELDEL